MNIDELIQEAHEQTPYLLERLLNKDKRGKFVCPKCHSGDKKNKTSALQYFDDTHKVKCHGCGFNGDVIDIIGIIYNIPDRLEQFERTAELLNVSIEKTTPQAKPEPKLEPKPEPLEDMTAYYKQCNAQLELTDYWTNRGISAKTCNRFLLGFDKSIYFNAELKEQPAVIIPVSQYKYKVRCTEAKEYRNLPHGAIMELYNAQAINNDVVYITESEINALSIEELGKPAIAIRGTGNAELLNKLIKANKKDKTYMLCLDLDEAGTKATKIIRDFVEENGATAYDLRPLFDGYTMADNKPVNDINDMLVHHREKLAELLSLTAEQIKEKLAELKAKEYINTCSAKAYINSFINGIKESENTPPIATGYNNLDNILQGGLREGLYTIGAISSLGKTTYILQMADYIAKHGTDVIIFSLEMSHTELIGRSISRNTFNYCMETGININPYAKSSINITDGTKWKNYKPEEKHIIKKATEIYAEYSNHLFIFENEGQTGIAEIEKIVKRHFDITGRQPVVIIDYLQLLAPPQERLTEKQAVDITIVRLKKLSREYKIPIIAISSFNRENYNTMASFESFKESGGIEYTSNVTLAMQFKGVTAKTKNDVSKSKFDVNEAKRKNPREIEILILKNRDGQTGDKLQYLYYPQFNKFMEVKADE